MSCISTHRAYFEPVFKCPKTKCKKKGSFRFTRRCCPLDQVDDPELIEPKSCTEIINIIQSTIQGKEEQLDEGIVIDGINGLDKFIIESIALDRLPNFASANLQIVNMNGKCIIISDVGIGGGTNYGLSLTLKNNDSCGSQYTND